MLSTPKDSAAMTAALAKIDAMGRASLERREREKADTRLNWLADQIAALEAPPFANGFNGGRQMFAHLASSANYRQLRAKSLKIARKQQLFNHPPSVRFWLAKAAEQRRSEKHFLRAERIARCEEIDRRRMETLRAIDERRAASLAALDARRAG